MPNENENQTLPPVSVPKPPAPALNEQVGLRVSLIPSEEQAQNNPRRGFRKFIIAVVVFCLVIGGITGYFGYRVYNDKKEVAKLDAQTAGYAQQEDLLKETAKDARLAQTRLRSLATLLENHRTGLKILSFLEDHTLSDVSYSSFAVNATGTVSLAVKASSFETYAAQINEFKGQPEIAAVTSAGLSPAYDEKNNLKSVTFNLTIAFNNSIFKSRKAPSQTPTASEPAAN